MLLKILKRTIDKYALILPGSRVVVAFSGGADSTALLTALDEISGELDIDLFACHLNHKLRGIDADEDALFCRRFTAERSIPFYSMEMNVRAVSENRELNLEEGGRQARLVFYRRALRHFNADKIATAHIMNDQAESFLIRLLRGSGSEGLGGISPVYKGWIIRPLIECDRKTVENFLTERGIEHRFDNTNLDESYTRNRIRHNLIPLLKDQYNPNIIRTLAHEADIQRGNSVLLTELTDAFFEKITEKKERCVSIRILDFSALPVAIRRLILRKAYALRTGTKRGLTYDMIDELILAIHSRKEGYRKHLPDDVEFYLDEENLMFRGRTEQEEYPSFEGVLRVPGMVKVDQISCTWKVSILSRKDFFDRYDLSDANIGAFSADRFGNEITVRNRKDGDRIKPLGLGGTKKLKDIFIDRKIPTPIRECMPVFLNGRDIFWIPGIAVAEDYKVCDDTERILVFERIEG